MDVYVLFEGEYDLRRIVKIFKTKELLLQYCEIDQSNIDLDLYELYKKFDIDFEVEELIENL